MSRSKIIKIRVSPAEAKQWRRAADGLSVSAFVRRSVEASIVGSVDHDALQASLYAVRKTLNAASEAKTIEDARSLISIAKLHISGLRGK